MQKHFLTFLLCISALLLKGQDSIHVTLCSEFIDQCQAVSFSKDVEHFDSIGQLIKIEHYYKDNCLQPVDSIFRHTSDEIYTYDSTGNLTRDETYGFYTYGTYYSVTNNSYDLTGRKISSFMQYTWQGNLQNSNRDSTAYDSFGNIIYYLSENYNNSNWDTTTFTIRQFDNNNRLLYLFNLNTSYQSENFYQYDSIPFLISQYSKSILSGNPIDSFKVVKSYYSNSLIKERWSAKWDTLNFVWVNDSRVIYLYDTLAHKKYQYSFNCPDSLCLDSNSQTEFIYDNAWKLNRTNYYEYDHPGWLYDGGSWTYYDNFNRIIRTGDASINFSGCDDGSDYFYTYNSSGDLIHSSSISWHCNYDTSSCDYYNLSNDSMILVIQPESITCPYDTIHPSVTVEGGIPPYHIQWSPLNGILDPDSLSPRIIADTTITYQLTVSDFSGLVKTETYTLPVANSLIHPISISSYGLPCENSLRIFFDRDSVLSTMNFQWYLNGNPYYDSNDTIFPVFADGNYSVEIMDNYSGYNCSLLSPEISVTIDHFQNHFSHGCVLICDSGVNKLTLDNGITHLWSTGDTTNSIFIIQPGPYWVISTDSLGCIDSTYNYINNQFHIDLGNDTLICVNQPLSLLSQTNFFYYTWSDNSTSGSFPVNSTIAGLQTIWVTAIDYGYCESRDTINVLVDVCAGTENLKNDQFIVFPNPSDGFFNIDYPKQFENCTITISDMLGNIIVIRHFNENANSIQLASGVYELHIKSGSRIVYRTKLISSH